MLAVERRAGNATGSTASPRKSERRSSNGGSEWLGWSPHIATQRRKGDRLPGRCQRMVSPTACDLRLGVSHDRGEHPVQCLLSGVEVGQIENGRNRKVRTNQQSSVW